MDFSVRNLNVTVVGAARSGLAAVDLLQSKGARVTLADSAPQLADESRAEDLRTRGVRLELGPHTRDQFLQAQLLVVSPGVPLEQPAFEQALSLIHI